MMIAYKYLSKPIVLEHGIYHLVIENKDLFRKTLTALFGKNTEEWFVLSENYNPIDFNKNSVFISNALMVEMNNKRLLTKIHSDLAGRANDLLFEEMAVLRAAILDFAEKLTYEFDFDFIYDDEIETGSIIKLLNFRVRNDSNSHLESLMIWFEILRRYLGIKLFICCNLSVFFTVEEISELSLTAESAGISLLNIESIMIPCCDRKRISLIDNDLCELIDNEL